MNRSRPGRRVGFVAAFAALAAPFVALAWVVGCGDAGPAAAQDRAASLRPEVTAAWPIVTIELDDDVALASVPDPAFDTWSAAPRVADVPSQRDPGEADEGDVAPEDADEAAVGDEIDVGDEWGCGADLDDALEGLDPA